MQFPKAELQNGFYQVLMQAAVEKRVSQTNDGQSTKAKVCKAERQKKKQTEKNTANIKNRYA
jgi:hypothetical protein